MKAIERIFELLLYTIEFAAFVLIAVLTAFFAVVFSFADDENDHA